MATSYYALGTVTLTNGSALVTGNGTGWQLALITNGLLAVKAAGNLLLIETVNSDTQITAEQEWIGASGTYSYSIVRQTDQLQDNAENSRALAYLISEMRNGTLFKYDSAGDFASRGVQDAKPKGYSYLVLEGDAAQLYVKASNTEGDWAGPFAYGVGPRGAQGPVGFLDFKGDYNPASTYVPNDGVRRNGSSWVAIQNVPTNTPPPNVPGPDTAYWSLLAVKGQDGAGTGDMEMSLYDPQYIQEDAFARGNHTGDLPDSVSFADGTKKGRFDVGLVTAGQSRVWAMPDRDAVIDPIWERAGVVNLTGVSYAVFPNLAPFRSLRLRIEAVPQNGAGVPFLRVGQDNGASWNAGATDYGYAGLGVSGTAVAAAGTASISYFPVAGQLSANVMEFTALLNDFNKERATIVHSNCSHFNQAAVHSLVEYWGYRGGNIAHNALLFGTTSGIAFTHGIAYLEGIRG